MHIRQKKWGFVPDYARLDIIHKNGGIYLDCDVELVANLDALLYDKAFCGLESAGIVAFGLGFGAVKGYGLLQEMMDCYDEISFFNQDGSLNLNPAPFYQMRALKRYAASFPNQLQLINELRIYPTDVLAPLDFVGNPLAFTQNTYAMHHYDASWFDEKDATKRSEMLKRVHDFWTKYSHDILRREDE